ncbi:MAG: pro-sigmaK processing inhibitor BofA family protein [Acidaminococcaceae bacterium]|nr:pro-sigmaK processing inhibitor BofA family protein [Acidaminococcaceae bacterium]
MVDILIALVVLFVLFKLLSLPFKILVNGVIGAVMLWIFNILGSVIGFTMEITLFKALIAGIFGIPGVVALVAYQLLAV